MLHQEHGGKQRPVLYFSSRLNTVVAGLPGCLNTVASAEKAVLASRDLEENKDLSHFVSLLTYQLCWAHYF